MIVLPLSLPSVATMTLFYAAAHWNNYFNPMLYITEPKLFTLQIKLRQLLLEGNQAELTEGLSSVATVSQESLKGATIIFSTLPILICYPWLQKYFKRRDCRRGKRLILEILYMHRKFVNLQQRTAGDIMLIH